MEELQAYVDRLVEEKGLDTLEPDILDEIKADLHARLEDRINTVILANLPPGELAAFEKLLDEGTDDEVQEFCRKHIQDLDQLVAGELVAFKDTYLS